MGYIANHSKLNTKDKQLQQEREKISAALRNFANCSKNTKHYCEGFNTSKKVTS